IRPSTSASIRICSTASATARRKSLSPLFCNNSTSAILSSVIGSSVGLGWVLQFHLSAPFPMTRPHQDLCGPTGRAWLSEQILPGDERLAVERHLREFDRLTDDLKVIERDLAQSALADDRATRLMTVPGINMVVALALIAAIGDITRFAKPEQLVGYLGLNPSVRQSGPGPAYHGRITKQGRGHARGMLVEA